MHRVRRVAVLGVLCRSSLAENEFGLMVNLDSAVDFFLEKGNHDGIEQVEITYMQKRGSNFVVTNKGSWTDVNTGWISGGVEAEQTRKWTTTVPWKDHLASKKRTFKLAMTHPQVSAGLVFFARLYRDAKGSIGAGYGTRTVNFAVKAIPIPRKPDVLDGFDETPPGGANPDAENGFGFDDNEDAHTRFVEEAQKLVFQDTELATMQIMDSGELVHIPRMLVKTSHANLAFQSCLNVWLMKGQLRKDHVGQLQTWTRYMLRIDVLSFLSDVTLNPSEITTNDNGLNDGVLGLVKYNNPCAGAHIKPAATA